MLVVEDNDALRRLVVRQLVDIGYQVIAAPNAAEALAALEREPVDVLFTDVVMAGEMDGFALARAVMSRWPRVRIVLTSGFPEARPTGEPGSPSITPRILSKPYRKQELARVLRDALGA